MYKTVEDLMCVPLIVTAEELLPLITNTQHLRDFERISMFDKTIEKAIEDRIINELRCFKDKDVLELEDHIIDLEKQIKELNEKLTKQTSGNYDLFDTAPIQEPTASFPHSTSVRTGYTISSPRYGDVAPTPTGNTAPTPGRRR